MEQTIDTTSNTATPRQRWALYCITKKDYRNVVLSKEEASDLIKKFNEEKGVVSTSFEKIYEEADKAGKLAVEELVKGDGVVPMVVEEHTDMLDDNSPVKQAWFVADGPCGFAWIDVKPRNCAFAKWLKEKKLGNDNSYAKAITIWVHDYNQSIQKKEKYAYAFAGVLQKHGIKAHANSRMD